jgi:hypothetical protein
MIRECVCLELEVNLKITASFFPMHQRKKRAREKDQFYEQLERTYKQCPSYDTKIMLGDMNVKVEKNIWTGIVMGTCGLHDERNDNRMHPTYAVHPCMVIVGTLLPHRNIYKETWHGPHDRTVNQTDHVMIDWRHCSNLLDVRSY